MKKLILAFVALACAFAISSCCDRGRSAAKGCKKQEAECTNTCFRITNEAQETPCRLEKTSKDENPPQERQHRRW